jgi:integrase
MEAATTINPGELHSFLQKIKEAMAVLERAFEVGLLKSQSFEMGNDKAVITHATPKPATIGEVIKEFLAAKTAANRSPMYIHTLKFGLLNFAKHFENRAISSIEVNEFEDFINRFQNPGTRRTYRALLSVLCAFAVRKRFLKDNPIEQIDHISIERKAPLILTPPQVETLLAACPQAIKPYVILATFVGLRPMEIVSPIRRLDWSAVNLQTRAVAVVGKRRRRMAPMEPRAIELLRDHWRESGPLCPPYPTVSRWMRTKAAPLFGWKTWPADTLRHTAASYLMALYEDVGKVSTRLGNSPEILLTHYHQLVTEADCKAFWKT